MAKYNLATIKRRHSYSIEEIAALFAINEKTVQRWIQDGLHPIVPNRRPYLFMGEQLKIFLAGIKKERKTTLKKNEMYCLACKKAVVPTNFCIEETGNCIGKNNLPQMRKVANCPTCNRKMVRLLLTSPEKIN